MDQGVQRFLQMMEDDAEATAAFREVWADGEQAVGPLLDSLEEESNGDDRNAVVKNLHQGLEVVGSSAALPLCQRLPRAALPAQVNLVLALPALGPVPAEVLPFLVAGLADSSEPEACFHLRIDCAIALGRSGQATPEVIELLVRVAETAAEAHPLWTYCIEALMELGPAAERAALALRRLCLDEDEDIRGLARSAFFVVTGRANLAAEKASICSGDSPRQNAQILTLRALEAIRKGDQEGAFCQLNEAIRLDAGLANAWFCRGKLHEEAGRFALARQDLERAVELDDSDPQWHLHLAQLLATCPDPSVRDEQGAASHRQRAERLGLP